MGQQGVAKQRVRTAWPKPALEPRGKRSAKVVTESQAQHWNNCTTGQKSTRNNIIDKPPWRLQADYFCCARSAVVGITALRGIGRYPMVRMRQCADQNRGLGKISLHVWNATTDGLALSESIQEDCVIVIYRFLKQQITFTGWCCYGAGNNKSGWLGWLGPSAMGEPWTRQAHHHTLFVNDEISWRTWNGQCKQFASGHLKSGRDLAAATKLPSD